MSRRRYVVTRVLFAVFAMYLVLSVTFGFLALTGNPQVAAVAHATARSDALNNANASERNQAVREAVRRYRETHNLDQPVAERYVRWLWDVTTLDWGRSYSRDAPVTAVLARAAPTTLAYVLPAMLFALVGGVGLGLYGALDPGSPFDRLASAGSYLAFGVPNYWLAKVAMLFGVVGLAVTGRTLEGPTVAAAGFLGTVVLPAAILGTGLLAGQQRYARAESREYANAEFVKLVRAKGATDRGVARHVLKNAAVPLLSLFFADLLGVLVVNVFVLEGILGIRGIGYVGLEAITQRDMPLVLGIAMTIAVVGVVGNLIQDLAYAAIDPRIESTE